MTGAEKGEDILIDLSKDSDSKVRNWATFALGSQLEYTNELIIDALLQGVNDPDLEIAGEAIIGLANKGYDPIDAIISEKRQEDDVNFLFLKPALFAKIRYIISIYCFGKIS